jgi:hypothetical protein
MLEHRSCAVFKLIGFEWDMERSAIILDALDSSLW